MAFVHFRNGGTPDVWKAEVEAAGLTAGFIYKRLKAVLVAGTLEQVLSLRNSSLATHLEKNEQLEMKLESSVWASNLGPVRYQPVTGTYTAPDGTAINGSGVGVAVIDSGVDQTHPDFAGRIDGAYEVTCSLVLVQTANGRCFPDPVLVPQPIPTEPTAGHGTHVAGIALGSGKASSGTYTGMAPGARLTSFSVGEGPSAAFASFALEFLADKLAEDDPAFEHIKVVNNSYGNPGGSEYDPEGIVEVAAAEIVAQGVTMVFAASNDGGDGSSDSISSYGKHPTPGVISVANYDDGGVLNLTTGGGRNETLSSSSSRGAESAGPGNAQTSPWPDLSAPGGFITAACVLRPTECANPAFGVPSPAWAPYYANIGGTSMAAPHVAGIVALLYQVRPSITPAEVEDILKDTSYKFTGGADAPGSYAADPRNPGGTTSFDKGAGLIDAALAITEAGAKRAASITAPPALTGTAGTVHQVTGTFDTDDEGARGPSTDVLIAEDPAGDATGTGAADIIKVEVSVTPSGPRFTITVADLAESHPALATSLRATFSIDGISYVATVLRPAAGGAWASSPAKPTDTAPESKDIQAGANSVSFTVLWTSLGSPKPGTPVHNVFGSGLQGLIADVAPGGPGATLLTHPEFGSPFLVGPTATGGTVQRVTASVDGGPRIEGAISANSYALDIPTTGLAPGSYNVRTVLDLDGEPSAAAWTRLSVLPAPVTSVPSPPASGGGTTIPSTGGGGGGGTSGPPVERPPAGSRPPGATPAPEPAPEPKEAILTRVQGNDRIDTSVAASLTAFNDRSAEVAILARADRFADGLAGTSLAVAYGGPLLLTPGSGLDVRVADELNRVLPEGGRVFVLGGPAALPLEMDAQLEEMGYVVRRLAGKDRFETAALVARAQPRHETILVATGQNFADALAAGAAAAQARGTVVLTDDGSLPKATADYLAEHPGAEIFAIGGPAAAALPDAYKVVGADRFETSVQAAAMFFEAPSLVGLTTGVSFPDALSGGALVGRFSGPLLLTAPDRLSPIVADYLNQRAGSIDDLFVFGGENAVSRPVVDEALEALRS